jgi:hypothetical protein
MGLESLNSTMSLLWYTISSCFNYVWPNMFAADVMKEIMHRFRPEFMHLVSGPPAYYVTEGNSHSCMVQSKLQGPRVSYLSVDGSNFTKDEECQTCGDCLLYSQGYFAELRMKRNWWHLQRKWVPSSTSTLSVNIYKIFPLAVRGMMDCTFTGLIDSSTGNLRSHGGMCSPLNCWSKKI